MAHEHPQHPQPGWQRSLEGGTKENLQLIYVAYLLGITALIGVVMAYVNRPEAEDWARDHYTFLIRTFWIGCAYGLVGVILSFVIIGIPMLIMLAILNIVFPIIAAVKANEGKVWRYPLSISFLK